MVADHGTLEILAPNPRMISRPTVVIYFSKISSSGSMPSSILDRREYAIVQSMTSRNQGSECCAI